MKLCVIAGDGIGHEVLPVAVGVLQAVLPGLQLVFADAGWEEFCRNGQALPERTLAAARECGAVFFGAVSSPMQLVEGYRSPIVQLRRELGCHANIRPTLSLPMASSRSGIDLIIVRENTEDLYVGDEQSDGDVAVAIKRITRKASLRVARSAFELARNAGRQRITIIHKANILPRTDGLFRDCAREVARDFPEIMVDEMLVDTAALRLAQAPESFDMLLAPNLYGDILSDLAAAFGGGLGLAPSLNLGLAAAIAEPVHGSAPDIAGQGIANPLAAILSAAMLLRVWWQRPELALRIEQAVRATLLDGIATPDVMSPGVSTQHLARAVIERIRHQQD
jgi:homoisocitrate dehydrogenase